MKNKLTLSSLATKLFLITCMTFNFTLNASSDFYGKINMSIAQIDDGLDTETDTLNNASRVGFKSKLKLSDNLNFLIQIENEIDPTDGRADGDKVFKQRNTFIGISEIRAWHFYGVFLPFIQKSLACLTAAVHVGHCHPQSQINNSFHDE